MLGAFKGLFYRQIERRQAVAGITFSVDEGEIVGVIGPNNAGKSTTVKCMMGILVPSGGRVLVGGIVPWEQRRLNARQIGVVFGQKTALWWDVPVIETFNSSAISTSLRISSGGTWRFWTTSSACGSSAPCRFGNSAWLALYSKWPQPAPTPTV